MKAGRELGRDSHVEGFAEQDEARGVVCDGERVAVPAVAELELALEIGAPEVVGAASSGEGPVPWARWRLRPLRRTRPWRSRTAWTLLIAGTRTSPARRRTRSSRILRAPPVWSLLLEADDQTLDLVRQLVGLTGRLKRSVSARMP